MFLTITVFHRTNINIRSRELNRPWVKEVLGLLNFGDISHHCWITYSKNMKQKNDQIKIAPNIYRTKHWRDNRQGLRD